MSYAAAEALQAAVFARLSGDPALSVLVGGAIHDAVPPGTPPGLFVLVGEERAVDASDRSAAGAEHRLTISVVGSVAGFRAIKAAAVAVSDALTAAPLPSLVRGRLVGLWFDRAEARRGRGAGGAELRRIDMVWRARTEDDPAA